MLSRSARISRRKIPPFRQRLGVVFQDHKLLYERSVFDNVLRHMIVRVDEELAAAERARVRRKTDMAERRTRRGLPPEPTETERKRHAEEDDDAEMGMEQMFRGGHDR